LGSAAGGEVWFISDKLTYQKLLGVGGNGLVLHYKYQDASTVNTLRRQQSFAIKMDLTEWGDVTTSQLREEIRMMKVRT
jgi:hypothetical protein